MAPKVFICYRRDDSAGHAGRVHDRLEREFGRDLLFMDVDAIPLGVNFVKVLSEEVAKCDALLAIIGPGWLDARDENGNRRLDNPFDFVRVEIGTALKRNIPVIPLLLEGTRVPKADQLPADLKELALRNGIDVRHASFPHDMERLIRGLRGAKPSQQPAPAAPSLGRPEGEVEVDATIVHRALRGGRRLLHGVRPLALAAAVAAIVLAWVAARQAGVPVPWPSRPAETASSEGSNAGKVRTEAEAAAGKKAEDDKGSAADARRVQENAARQNPALAVQPGSGQSFRDRLADGQPCPTCPEMVVVPKGKFTMGSPYAELQRTSNETQVSASIATPFAVGKFAVTRGEFAAFVDETGYRTVGGCFTWSGSDWKHQDDTSWRAPGFAQDDRHPVVCVNWDDAKTYAEWLSSKTGQSYRLPSEAEREYATRAGTTTPFWWGTSITPAQANYAGNATYAGGGSEGEYRQRTVPVDSFEPNPWGLYNVHGNVREWTEDCWNDSNSGNPGNGSARTTGDCARRATRGGSWDLGPEHIRSASRYGSSTDLRINRVGFRVGRGLRF